MSTFEHDLTKGNIWKQLVWFAVPFFISNLIQSLYSLIDLIILGHFGGTNSISAANIGGQVLVILTNLAAGLSGGGTVMLGNYLGSKRKDKINGAISTLLTTLTVMAAVFMVLLFILKQPLLRLLDTPEEAFSQAEQYLFICTLGLLFIYGYNALSAIMRGLGDSRTPMIFVMIACVINIILDLVLVAGCHMDAAGAAIATVAAQAVSVVFAIILLVKKQLPFTITKADFRLNEHCKKALKTGLPLALQECLTQGSFLALCAFVNRLGLEASSGYGVACKVVNFAMLVPSSLMQSMASFVSQNVGAGNEKRAKKAMYSGMGIGLVIGCIVFALVMFKGNLLTGIFTTEQVVIQKGYDYLRGFALESIVTAILFSMIGYFNGHDKTLWVMIQGLIQTLLVRLPLAYYMSIQPDASLMKIGLAAPVATIFGIVINIIFYIHMNKKMHF